MDTTVSDTQTEQKSPSIGSKLLFAAAFATIGAKLSFIGNAIDGAKLMGGEGTLGDKMRGVIDGTLVHKLKEGIDEQILKNAGATAALNPKAGDYFKASTKVFKYTYITTIAGVAGGAVLGWVRGGKVENAKDILVHPIDSLKLVLGIGPKDEHTDLAAKPSSQPDAVEVNAADPKRTDWNSRITDRKAVALNMAR